MRTVLVTGAGGAPAYNFIESLRLAGEPVHLVGTDCDRYHLALAPTDERFLVPPASDADYLPLLRRLIRLRGVDLLVAQPDPEVAAISAARDTLDTNLCLPSHATVVLCQDKYRTYCRWREQGLPQPETRLLSRPADLDALFERRDSLWLRPLRGAAGRGSLHARSRGQAVAWLDLNDGWGSYTGAEYLSPHSVTWQSLWDHGRLLVAQGRRRLYWEYGDRTLSGVTGITGGATTLSESAVDRVALQAIRAVDPEPHGIFSVDMTYDAEGVPNPTEINIGRFFTTQLFFTRAGLNMPHLMLRLALYGEQPASEGPILNPLPDGLLWLRAMDREPVLTSEAAIEPLAESLQEARRLLSAEKASSS